MTKCKNIFLKNHWAILTKFGTKHPYLKWTIIFFLSDQCFGIIIVVHKCVCRFEPFFEVSNVAKGSLVSVMIDQFQLLAKFRSEKFNLPRNSTRKKKKGNMEAFKNHFNFFSWTCRRYINIPIFVGNFFTHWHKQINDKPISQTFSWTLRRYHDVLYSRRPSCIYYTMLFFTILIGINKVTLTPI